MRWWRVGVAIVLLALAAFAAMLAADLRSWRDAVRTGDARFAQAPASARWTADTILPGDPARRILDLSDQLALRRTVRSFREVVALGNGIDNGFSESRLRGDVESTLSGLAQGPDRRWDSLAQMLVGILAFADSKQRGPAAAAPVERSVAAFQSAVRLDPANADAKFDLEWLLRKLAANGTRKGSNGTSGGPGKGHRGAGGGVPGRGY
jgi:hypothetical protein